MQELVESGAGTQTKTELVTDENLDVPHAFRIVPDARKRAYLVARSVTPSKRIACKVADIDPKTEYNWRNRARNTPQDPASKAYLEALAIAEEMGIESAESEAWERATHGWQEPVFGTVSEPVEIPKADGTGTRIVWRNRTAPVGEITKKSDTMLIFMLKAAKPETYRDNVHHSGAVGLTLQIIAPDNGRRRLPSTEGESQ